MEVRVVDLSGAGGLRPVLKLCGVAALGYRYGWFELSNGHKGFLAVYRYGRGRRAVVVVLRDGTYVIMSPRSLDKLVSALKAYGWLR